MSRIELFLCMAAQAHVDTAGAGHKEFIRPFHLLLGNNEPSKAAKGRRKNKELQNGA